MRMLTAIAVGFCSALMLAGQALAQPVVPGSQGPGQPQSQSQVITTITAAQVATVLQGAGYQAAIQTGTNGAKYVTSTMSGVKLAVFLYGCTNDNCTTLQFYAGWQKDASLTVTYANAWNAAWRYAKAYIDSDGDFAFTLDVDLDGGVTSDNIKQNAQLFDYLLGQLGKFTGK